MPGRAILPGIFSLYTLRHDCLSEKKSLSKEIDKLFCLTFDLN